MHKTRNRAFLLIVDDFGVKYIKREDAENLSKTLQDRYPMKEDSDPEFYLGVTLDFDYDKRTYKLLMPGYVKQALVKFYNEFNKQQTHHHHLRLQCCNSYSNI